MNMKRWVSANGPMLVLLGALAVSAPRLAAVFSVVEPDFLGHKIAWLTGPGYGLATSLCAFYAWHVYQARKQLKLARWLVAGWFMLLVLMACIQVPAIVAVLRGQPLAALLLWPLDLLWATLLAISSELVVMIMALALALSKDQPRLERRGPAQKARASDKARPSADRGLQYKQLKCPRCGATSGKDGKPFRRMQQVNAHLRWCAGSNQQHEQERKEG